MRTSIFHPLQIASIETGQGRGRIGVTFCPGKKQPDAATGARDRDLDADLDSILSRGASAILSLNEETEILDLGVPGLGTSVTRRHMRWYHLPIRDMSAPGAAFEGRWAKAGREVRARLRHGSDILVHCKGGLGRAGTVAARLQVELGCDPDTAIGCVRAARPGAIETPGQERHVRSARPVDDAPDPTPGAARDRAIGALVGLAIGNAVGTTLEVRARFAPAAHRHDRRRPSGLRPGEWTDDTAMALAWPTACGGPRPRQGRPHPPVRPVGTDGRLVLHRHLFRHRPDGCGRASALAVRRQPDRRIGPPRHDGQRQPDAARPGRNPALA